MDNLIQYENPPEKLLTAVEVAELLNVSRAFVYKLMKRSEIPTVFIGGARRVRPKDLRTYIQACMRSQPE